MDRETFESERRTTSQELTLQDRIDSAKQDFANGKYFYAAITAIAALQVAQAENERLHNENEAGNAAIVSLTQSCDRYVRRISELKAALRSVEKL